MENPSPTLSHGKFGAFESSILRHKYANSSPQVVVVGAGIGGLVSALLMANAGAEVTVLESQNESGGKMRQLWPGLVSGSGSGDAQLHPEIDGIDSGPTVMTMKWVFEEIFDQVGADLQSEINLTQLKVLARHAWSADEGEQQLDLYADHRQNLDAVAQFSGAVEAKKFDVFCQNARDLYRHLEHAVIREADPSLKKMLFSLGPRGMATLASIGPMKSLWSSLGHSFSDSRLRQLFARYATYCGSSPWSAPATLMLIAQVEMDGVWSVKGGMRTLAKTLERLAKEKGVKFHYGTSCQEIETHNGEVKAVHTSNEDRLDAHAVFFNGDKEALMAGKLGEKVQQKFKTNSDNRTQRSLSAVTWTMRCEVSEDRFKLDRHNVFFQNHYYNEFDDIFNKNRLPQTPTVYLCAQNRGLEVAEPPSGMDEPLFCLINAPANGDTYEFTQKELDQCEMQTFGLLRRCGLQLHREALKTIQVQPKDFHRLFPSTGGALYGEATHGWMQVFSRLNAKTPIKGLFLTGGSVHPGPGVPMAAMSGRMAAGAAMAHLGLTNP
jgi:1-hydroxycarotenoid 3,4-desaturase